MKFRKNKKGFTIVELIIVIAVIGILTAVMVPTIIHLVGKANKASDDALVSNLNKASQLREAELGKPETMHDAVLGLEDYGYKLDALVAKSDQSLLYNLKENRFLLAGDAKEADKAQYWQIRDNADDKETYNIYASSKFNVSNVSELKVGFDAGFQENISSVEYIGERDGLIRTNGSTQLTVETDHNVYHYGESGDINIKKVKMESFHEYGVVVGSVTIKAGHFVAEAGSTATSIVVAEDAGASSVKVTNVSDETIYVSGKVASLSPESSADLETIENAPGVTDAVASVAGVGYASFNDAFANATEENGVVLLKNIELSSVLLVNKSTKIDLNGKTFLGADVGNCEREAICFNSKTTKYKLSLDGSVKGSLVDGDIWVGSACTGELDIDGGRYEGHGYTPFTINGNALDTCVFNIKSATIYADRGQGWELASNAWNVETGWGMYLAGPGAVTLTDCTVIGQLTGIEVRAGSLTLNNCVVSGAGDPNFVESNGNGGTTYGAAVAVAKHNTNHTVNVVVNGGEYVGAKALTMVDPRVGAARVYNAENAVSVVINAGKFVGAVENTVESEFWTLENNIINA